MLFNSHAFLFAFLPVCLAGFFLLGRWGWTRAASLWLSAMSLVFYAWWNPDPTQPWSPRYLALILGSIVFNYLLGVRIAATVERGAPLAAKAALTVGVVVNLGALAWFKYAGFLAANVNALLGTRLDFGHVALPLAISFFTFTQIAYLVDAFHGKTREDNFRWYLLFVSFFPHLIAGPIVLYRSLMPQFARSETWRFHAQSFAVGVTVFAFGLFKKVVIADTLSPIAGAVFGGLDRGTPGLTAAWLGALAYTLQLYFDFSGYSDMAIGLGRMFNVRFPQNFDSPYKARDLIDFWRRWHISLSNFLRDHLYIPLGGNRKGPARRTANLFLTMLLGGLWHGAGWTFIVWGALHGALLIINHTWNRATAARAWTQGPAARIAGRAATLLAVVAGWVIFRAETLPEAVRMLGAMAGTAGTAAATARFEWIVVGLAGVLALFAPNTNELFRAALPPREDATIPPPLWRYATGTAAITGLILAAAIAHLSRASEFLYFQF